MQADFVQQRVGNGLLGGLNGAIFAARLAGAHHCLAHLVHHRAHVGKVQVDQAGAHHQVGHALYALIEHIIGHGEGFGEGGLFIGQTEQVLVRNDDQRVDDLLQRLDTFFGLPHPLCALKLEGLCHNAHRQDPQFACGMCDDRRGPRAGAAPHAGRDEAHMRPCQVVDDLLDRFLGGGGPHGRARPGAQTFGNPQPHLDGGIGAALHQRLRVRIGNDEFDTLKVFVDHVVDGIAARTTDTEDRNAGLQLFPSGIHYKVKCHCQSACFLLPRSRLSGASNRHPVRVIPRLSAILPTDGRKVTKKTRNAHKIWAAAKSFQRYFAVGP